MVFSFWIFIAKFQYRTSKSLYILHFYILNYCQNFKNMKNIIYHHSLVWIHEPSCHSSLCSSYFSFHFQILLPYNQISYASSVCLINFPYVWNLHSDFQVQGKHQQLTLDSNQTWENVGYILWIREKNPNDFKLVEHLPVFHREIFSSFNECKKTMLIQSFSMADILSQPIWCNCLFKCKGNRLCLPIWIKSGIRYIRELYNENGDIKSSGDILEQLIDKRNWMSEFKVFKTVLKHAIDKIQKEIFIMTRISNKYSFNFLTWYYCFLDQKRSFFYKNLLEKISVTYTPVLTISWVW